MKRMFARGFVLGVVCTSLVAGAWGFGSSSWASRAEPNAGRCRVSTGAPRLVSSQRCYNDNEVMIGYETNYIYCSRLTVDCDAD